MGQNTGIHGLGHQHQVVPVGNIRHIVPVQGRGQRQVVLKHKTTFLKDLKGNSLYKIKNKGIPYQEDDEWIYGDLFVNIKIVLPELDELYENINELIEEEETVETVETVETEENNLFVEVSWEHIFQE